MLFCFNRYMLKKFALRLPKQAIRAKLARFSPVKKGDSARAFFSLVQENDLMAQVQSLVRKVYFIFQKVKLLSFKFYFYSIEIITGGSKCLLGFGSKVAIW